METLKLQAAPGWHAVQFYESDAELSAVVAPYLAAALQAGGTAIVVATDVHRAAFRLALERAAIDVDGAISDGTVIARDAADALATFTRGGQVDAEAFRRTIGAIVGDAAARGGPVHVYGEMVAILWDAGDLPAVIALEQLWNELGDETRFALLCGYRRSALSDSGAAEVLGRVCALHSDVHHSARHGSGDFDPRALEVARTFAADAGAPRAARQFIAATLSGWGYSGSLVDDAQLVISELTTNAVVHARSTVRVGARIERGDLWLKVQDDSSALPRVGQPEPGTPRGRGLHVVSALSEDWGVDVTTGEKTVWARLRSVQPSVAADRP